MLSRRCRDKNEVTIPRILAQRAALSSGSDSIDMSTAENMLMHSALLETMRKPAALGALSEKVRLHGGCGQWIRFQAFAYTDRTFHMPKA